MQAQISATDAAVFPMRREAGPGDLKLIGVAKTFARDAEIFAQGDGCDFVFKVVSGAVRAFRLLADGRRQIIDFYLPGDVFGVEFNAERLSGAEALSDSVIVVARRSGLGTDGDSGARVWRHAIDELRRSQDHILTLGRRSAAERVASFLIDLAERLGVSDDLELPMSRQDIADYLGLTIETVSRTLTQLQSHRLIDLHSCRKVRLSDRPALEDLRQ